jgi:hypothetical protein
MNKTQKPIAWIAEFENGEQELHFEEPSVGETITPLYTAPPQPAQEPVAYLCKPDQHGLFDPPTPDKACKDCFPVYTAPQQRPWVGLKEEEQSALVYKYGDTPVALCLETERKLKEKNT